MKERSFTPPAWFTAYQTYGLDRLSDSDRRSGRICNTAALAVTLLILLFAAGYGLYDFAGLWPMFAACLFSAAICITTPLLMARNFVLGFVWIGFGCIFLMTFNTYLASRDAWLHLTLATSYPAVVLLMIGLTRLRLALATALVGLSATLLCEVFFVTPSPWVRVNPTLLLFIRLNILASTTFMIVGFVYFALWRMNRAEQALAAEYARSERLLDNLLPEKIAARLKDEPDRIIADNIGQASILFADIVDFTPRAASLEPADLVRFLNRVFSAFDEETDARGLEKIKTIGDAYMVAAGMPEPRADHAVAVADLALRMLEITEDLSAQTGQPVAVRIGIHTGPAVAGVIGTRKFFYDVWGDTVNTAARMESHGEPGRIQVTAETRAALGDRYTFEARGLIDIKGKGPTDTWWLTGRRTQSSSADEALSRP